VITAIQAASRTPLLGFWVTPTPLAKGFKTVKILSLAIDCKILGAPKKDAMAEESVAAITPAVISHGIRETFFMAL